MIAIRESLSARLEKIAEALDISATEYERAVRSYKSVGEWLDGGTYPGCNSAPRLYPQGSLRLGTIVKPLIECDGAGYDVDIVCELPCPDLAHTPEEAKRIKQMVGDRLREHGTYKEKLDKEGRRCWTLEYEETNGVGFHLDVLPCIPDPDKGQAITFANPGNQNTRQEFTATTVALTHRESTPSVHYSWTSGNPDGYAAWFQARNSRFHEFSEVQKRTLLVETRSIASLAPIYESLADVPDELVRTPLQRAIQIMKRHRDIYFGGTGSGTGIRQFKYRPISMIITTLAARLYDGEEDLYTTLVGIVRKLVQYATLTKNRYAMLSEDVAQPELVKRYPDGTWKIENPVNPGENFADRWDEEDEARAKAFFEWAEALGRDLQRAVGAGQDADLKLFLGERFGERAVNEAWTHQEDGFLKFSQVPAGAPQTQLSRFAVRHRERPQWMMSLRHRVSLSGQIQTGGGWQPFSSDCTPLPKHCKLRFRAETDVPKPFTVHWQVVNTGSEAEAKGAEGLRGQIYRAATAGAGGLDEMWRIREESTLYRGMHWVECFIVKDGVCVARSGEFVVNIE